jgi:prepilin-type N-terminal cleavage/methylation domain-containing protein
MRSQRGMSLIELVVVVAIGCLAVAVTVICSAPWVARESMRSAANDVHSFMQLAKIEAASRNRDARFVVDTQNRTLEVWDSLGTDSDGDDVRLHVASLPTTVIFDRPDVGDPVTLDHISGTKRYEAVFTSDGIVSDGVGAVFLYGGEKFGSVELYAAGGTEIKYWNGTGWRSGF